MLDWMGGNVQETPDPTRTINCAFGDIEILGPDRFIIAEFAQFGGSGYFFDTSDLSSIVAILNCKDWSEDEINEAVADICAAEGLERQSNVANRRNFVEDAE